MEILALVQECLRLAPQNIQMSAFLLRALNYLTASCYFNALQLCLQFPTQISFLTTLPAVMSGVVRIRFLSSTSVHSFSRFVVHYSTTPPGSRPCGGLIFADDQKNWHHVAATLDHYNKSAVSMKIYINGTVRADAIASSQKVALMALVGEMGLAIGRPDPGRPPPVTMPLSLIDTSKIDEIGYQQGSESFWAAGLDEMRLWNFSRTAEEIIAGLSTTCKTGVNGAFGRAIPVLCYSFDSLDLRRGDGKMYFTDFGLDPPIDAQAVVGDRFAPWCTTLGDGGALVDKVITLVQLRAPSCFWMLGVGLTGPSVQRNFFLCLFRHTVMSRR
jgi:hypothetical protein